jgi:hypothetical protein
MLRLDTPQQEHLAIGVIHDYQDRFGPFIPRNGN